MSETTAKSSPIRIFGQPKMATLLVLGFSSGLPFYLTSKTLQAWMTTAKVDLATIGFFSLVTLPYSLKFVWAPVMDRYIPPFLGRRRGWVLITQAILLIAIAAMSLHDPRLGLRMLAVNAIAIAFFSANAIAIAFFSASQDISLDAYRTDVLQDREMGAGAAVFVMGYRVALLVTGGLALYLADSISWPTVYLLLASLMLIGVVATFLAPEPVLRELPPRTIGEAVILPFREFFQRTGLGRAFLVLLFIVVYKYSDSLAGSMTTPFLLRQPRRQHDNSISPQDGLLSEGGRSGVRGSGSHCDDSGDARWRRRDRKVGNQQVALDLRGLPGTEQSYVLRSGAIE